MEVIGYALVSTVERLFDDSEETSPLPGRVCGFKTESEAKDYAVSVLMNGGICKKDESGFFVAGDGVSKRSGELFGSSEDPDNVFPDASSLLSAFNECLAVWQWFSIMPIVEANCPKATATA